MTPLGDRLDSTRTFACLALVAFHVCTGLLNSGNVSEAELPFYMRLFGEGLGPVRMPLFAFLAGVVYAVRTPNRNTFAHFLSGKVRRLAVPGTVAILVFVILADLTGTRFAVPLTDIWKVFAFPYAHFWFLQAILVLLVVVAAIDVFLGPKAMGAALILAVAFYLSRPIFPVDCFSVNRAAFLGPFFMFGVLCLRVTRGRMDAPGIGAVLMILAFVAVIYGFVTNYDSNAWGVNNRFAILVIGLLSCLGAYLGAPASAFSQFVAPYTFAVYLYHPIFSSGARRALNALGVSDILVHFVVGLAIGMAGPILIQRMSMNRSLTRRGVLGIRG